jgi:hypothetical protein
MSYSDLTLERACRDLLLVLNERTDLFAGLPGVAVSPFLRAVLEKFVPLGTAIHTEKARSEFIVAPILAEVRQLRNEQVSLFSGVSFDVDPARGLTGTCDFILADSPSQLILRAPVLMMIVEAKNDNMKSGLGQCAAEMFAAREFNEREREGPSTIYGAVTTGSNWRFLKLEDGTIFIDRPEYYLDQLETVLAVLLRSVGGDPSAAGAAA